MDSEIRFVLKQRIADVMHEFVQHARLMFKLMRTLVIRLGNDLDDEELTLAMVIR